MRKFLFYFSYFGKNFRHFTYHVPDMIIKVPDMIIRQFKQDTQSIIYDTHDHNGGLQKQSYSGKNDKSIAKYLEDGLICLAPLNTPKAYVSSRTDAGVHALCSTFQSLLTLPPSAKNYQREGQITLTLNKFFQDSSLDIRVHRTQLVPLEFNCRACAVSRTYIYRIALVETDKKLHNFRLPIPELHRCSLIESCQFDLKEANAVCDLFKGTHNFKNFCKEDKTKQQNTIRTIQELKIVPGKPFFDATLDPNYNDIKFFDVVISSGGFVWNQVRRIVGSIIDVASYKVPFERVEYFLNHPNEKWIGKTSKVAKPDGLFLQNIEYLPEAFLEESYQSDDSKKELMTKVNLMKNNICNKQ